MANNDETPPPPSASHEPCDIKAGNSSSSSPGSSSSDSGADPTLRKQIGTHLSTLTDVVNDNLIIIRYATFSTVFLLGAYGVANTPLFYRYKNLNGIASKVFTKRQRIHGRIVGVYPNVESSGRQLFTSTSSQSSKYWTDATATTSSSAMNSTQQQQQQKPITILFRHSSPIERLLTQSAMEKILQFTSASGKSSSPSGLLYSSSNPHRNLLPIELAGIVSPPTIATNNSASSVLSATLTKGSSPSSSPISSQVPEVLQSLIEKKARVSLQMLALRTISDTNGKDKYAPSSMMDENNNMHSAICHLSYRKPNQWFSTTNLGLELVQKGQALVNQDGLVIPNETSDNNNTASFTLIDFNPTVKQLQQDSTFISQLEEAEFAAWKSKEGVWSSSQMRELRKEYVEEEEYLNSSLWSRVKRGLSWIIGKSKR
jgi:hypothetical protein